MNEWCPDCKCEEYEILDEQTDFELGSISMSWLCKCNNCGCKFEIYRNYTLDPYYSYTQKVEENNSDD